MVGQTSSLLKLMLAGALAVGPALAWAAPKKSKSPAVATETEETEDEKPTKGKKAAPADDAAETHTKRAKEFADGKTVDKAKTKGQIDKLTGQVGDLESKMREKGKIASAADEEPATKKKGKKTPATKPVEKASDKTADAK